MSTGSRPTAANLSTGSGKSAQPNPSTAAASLAAKPATAKSPTAKSPAANPAAVKKPAASAAAPAGAAAPGADRKVAEELDSIVGYIRSAKREIAALCPEDVREKHIREATDELDAIVAHTEEATGGILDAAEAIENIAANVGGEHGEKLTEAVTRIYEACNFQDITGQRISKVVTTLKTIESRLASLAAALGPVASEPGAAAPAPGRQDARPDAHLLNGPQLPQSAKKQDEVDALLKNAR